MTYQCALPQPWKRKGLMYSAEVKFSNGHAKMTVTRKLNFISYHLIRYFHGPGKLYDMAYAFPKDW